MACGATSTGALPAWKETNAERRRWHPSAAKARRALLDRTAAGKCGRFSLSIDWAIQAGRGGTKRAPGSMLHAQGTGEEDMVYVTTTLHAVCCTIALTGSTKSESRSFSVIRRFSATERSRSRTWCTRSAKLVYAVRTRWYATSRFRHRFRLPCKPPERVRPERHGVPHPAW